MPENIRSGDSDAIRAFLADREVRAVAFGFGRCRVPTGWKRSDPDDWLVDIPVPTRMRRRGGKVHTSACLDNAEAILAAITEYCVRRRITSRGASTGTVLDALSYVSLGLHPSCRPWSVAAAAPVVATGHARPSRRGGATTPSTGPPAPPRRRRSPLPTGTSSSCTRSPSAIARRPTPSSATSTSCWRRTTTSRSSAPDRRRGACGRDHDDVDRPGGRSPRPRAEKPQRPLPPHCHPSICLVVCASLVVSAAQRYQRRAVHVAVGERPVRHDVVLSSVAS